jgi:hypothetical protein
MVVSWEVEVEGAEMAVKMTIRSFLAKEAKVGGDRLADAMMAAAARREWDRARRIEDGSARIAGLEECGDMEVVDWSPVCRDHKGRVFTEFVVKRGTVRWYADGWPSPFMQLHEVL